MDGKFERLVIKKMKKAVARLESDRLCTESDVATEIFVRPDSDQTEIISLMYEQHTNLNPS